MVIHTQALSRSECGTGGQHKPEIPAGTILQFLVELVLSDRQQWLMKPRFAMVTVPFALAVILGSVGYGIYGVAPLILSVLSLSRLIWFKLLPHEAKRLRSARCALIAVRPDDAIRKLQEPMRFPGVHFKMRRAILLSRAYIHTGQFREAHDVLNAVDAKSLLHTELISLACGWAKLFYEAGNPDEAGKRLESVSGKDCLDDPDYLISKSNLDRARGNLVGARELLEAGLDRNPADELRVLLLNNLAAIEGLQGRTDAQLRLLGAAHAINRTLARPDLVDSVLHNFAVSLVRAGRPDDAREVLNDALNACDSTNGRQVLEVLNNMLAAAREAGDQSWKREVYQEFERRIASIDSLLSRDRLALEISQLRMRRNDEIALQSETYEALIQRLLADLQAPLIDLPDAECVAALCEIFFDLGCEIESNKDTGRASVLFDLLRNVSQQLLRRRSTVEKHLVALSPKLTAPIETWYRYQTGIDKAEVFLAQSQNEKKLLAALDRSFKHLQEKAELFTEQGAQRQAIESWLAVCDEYLSYRDGPPVNYQPSRRSRYLNVATHGLDRIIELLEKSGAKREHIDHFIGLAFFSLRIRDDRRTAEWCVSVLKGMDVALGHYAIWLRPQYQWVLEQIQAQH